MYKTYFGIIYVNVLIKLKLNKPYLMDDYLDLTRWCESLTLNKTYNLLDLSDKHESSDFC